MFVCRTNNKVDNFDKKWHNSENSAKMAENKRRRNRLIMHFLVVFRGWNFKKSERKIGEKLKNRKKEREEEKKGKINRQAVFDSLPLICYSFLFGISLGVAGGRDPRTSISY